MSDDSHAAPARLITIPLSHFCEKARWGLDRVALRYREEPHAPLLSRLAEDARVRGNVRTAMGFEEKAQEAKHHSDRVRQFLLDLPDRTAVAGGAVATG